jgi:hypothetical protein
VVWTRSSDCGLSLPSPTYVPRMTCAQHLNYEPRMTCVPRINPWFVYSWYGPWSEPTADDLCTTDKSVVCILVVWAARGFAHGLIHGLLAQCFAHGLIHGLLAQCFAHGLIHELLVFRSYFFFCIVCRSF